MPRLESDRDQAIAARKAVAYVRVSTEEQAKLGVSLDAQEARLRAYSAMRGMNLVQVVTDAGVSAGRPLEARTGGARVLELVAAEAVDSVLAFKLDRLFRDCADCLTVTRGWDKRGVALHLVDLGGQALDTSTAMGRFFLTVMAGAAEMERNLISERTRAAMAYKRSQGQRVGDIPYGYRLAPDGQTLVPDPQEQRLLGRVRELRSQGLSLAAVGERLGAEGFEPRGGRGWYPMLVSRLARAAEAA